MMTEPFKGIIFLLQFIQGNAWPFSITWLKLNLQILLLDFYSFTPIWRLFLSKLVFIYPQLSSNGFPQLNTNSHFKIYYWNRTTQTKEQKQKSKATVRKSSLHVKLLTYVVVSIPLFTLFPLGLVWSFLQGLAGRKSRRSSVIQTFWSFPYNAATCTAGLCPAGSGLFLLATIWPDFAITCPWPLTIQNWIWILHTKTTIQHLYILISRQNLPPSVR